MTQTKQAKEETMRAIALDRFGGPETLKVQTVPIPEPDADEILIHVESAGVGAWDPFEREGGFVEVLGLTPKFPYVLGTDGAGTVAAVGKQVWDPDGQAASERGVNTGASARAWLHVRAGCSSGSRGR